jgi:hypothetical protein
MLIQTSHGRASEQGSHISSLIWLIEAYYKPGVKDNIKGLSISLLKYASFESLLNECLDNFFITIFVRTSTQQGPRLFIVLKNLPT